MPSVLFVCTANIIRSPAAAAIFQRLLDERLEASEAAAWVVASAGTWARPNDPASSAMRKLLAEQGIDLSSHRSRNISAELLAESNLVLVMEYGQKESLRLEFPACAGRVYALSEMLGLAYNIEDPIGRSEGQYRETLLEIEYLIKNGFKRILELANK